MISILLCATLLFHVSCAVYSGIPGIDSVYVFNLKNQPERHARTNALLSAVGIHAHFVTALDAVELRSKYKAHECQWNSTISNLKFCQQGDITSKILLEDLRNNKELSQQRIWKKMAQWQTFVYGWRCFRESGLRTALFLEDDIDISLDAVNKLTRIVQSIPTPWHVIRIGNCYEKIGQLAIKPDIYISQSQWCMDAYILNSDTIGDLLKCMDQPTLEWPNPDSHMDKFCSKMPNWRSYSIFPRIVAQLDKFRVLNSTADFLMESIIEERKKLPK